ncbi:hypothetical protein L208DRAFT_1415837 [Tricholoma matsutake]|nr:hypothetical protein L208DRAFT_1415837 [Tricholoma matsutake 945]
MLGDNALCSHITDDREEDNNGNSEDNKNNPNQLLAGWTVGATDNDNTGIGVGDVAGEWGTT